MDFAIENNLLCGALQLESPNQSERKIGSKIDLLIIHNISLPPGEYGTGCVDRLFCNILDLESHPFFAKIAKLKVSSHLMIDRQGTVTQFVSFDKKAWHAGESQYCGKADCNDYSIGLELEGTDFEAFSESQYAALITITDLLLQDYPCLSLERIVGHSDVAPGRKTDPGPYFDWDRYKSALNDSRQQDTTWMVSE